MDVIVGAGIRGFFLCVCGLTVRVFWNRLLPFLLWRPDQCQLRLPQQDRGNCEAELLFGVDAQYVADRHCGEWAMSLCSVGRQCNVL